MSLIVTCQDAFAQTYIGAQKCGSCHLFEYQVWSQGPHARAHLSLTAEQLKDTKCNSCHTLIEPATVGGADGATMPGVQCEHCHGAGKYYQAPYVMKDRELARLLGLVDITPQHCQTCHTEGAPALQPFDFARAWALIDHSRAAREAWEKGGEAPLP